MIESLFKKLHIKAKPEKILTYVLYGISILVALICVARLFGLAAGDIHLYSPTVQGSLFERLLPYIASVLFFVPALAFSFFVNSGIPKNDDEKIKMFMVTYVLLAIVVMFASSYAINWLFWTVVESIPKYKDNLYVLGEYIVPAVKITVYSFISFYRPAIDYFD